MHKSLVDATMAAAIQRKIEEEKRRRRQNPSSRPSIQTEEDNSPGLLETIVMNDILDSGSGSSWDSSSSSDSGYDSGCSDTGGFDGGCSGGGDF